MDMEKIDHRTQEQEKPPVQEPLSIEESCRQLVGYLEDILRDVRHTQRLDAGRLCEPCRELGDALNVFRDLAEELVDYSTQLSRGGLSMEFPENDSCLFGGLKNLHTNLKHLTRQAGQVTKGDYSQHVSHLGEFSEAFNTMTRQLKEREGQLKREIERARRRADIIESYTEMLVDLLDQRDEWMLVVDLESREIVHCNKRPADSGEEGAFCEKCQHRLPIQSKILEFEASERYKVWEIDGEKGACYRVISFPIEWKERPSCIHIVMNVTEEKMSARHLNDKRYHDLDTGIRNRMFLDEFMAQELREHRDFTLCYLDLEGVSDINTSYGRKVGDAYIQNFVEIVRKNFRSGDTFARIQDDKFCLVLTGNVKHLIERKMDEILTIFQRDDDRIFSHRCNFRYSITEVQGAENSLTLEEMLEKMQAAVKRKKKRKKISTMEFEDW